ncbi:Crp/Fnr family transcriptional regulator [Alteromonas mediterranea]|uniref:Crp/Fnr family transcriptional regulator n=1 Tax=Alteromonas mediterranea TaxID=314275 RepID=UPI000355823E|nr:cAMP-binding protein - catabolite protein activator and regulatory subunit of cAMP-dependent protein kinase [Alteromonas mediterranea U8]
MSYIHGIAQTVMPDDYLDNCMPYGNVKAYAASATIHDRGSKNKGLSIVVSGEVKIGNYGLDGSYQITTILRRGDTFGEFTLYASLARTHHAQALTECKILQIPEPAFHSLVSQHPAIAAFITRSLAIKLHAALERLDDIRRLPTHVQLAKLIYQAHLTSRRDFIPLRQSDYAERLGVTVLTAHKSLTKLYDMQLLEKRYGGGVISNIERLEKFLKESSSLLPI